MVTVDFYSLTSAYTISLVGIIVTSISEGKKEIKVKSYNLESIFNIV